MLLKHTMASRLKRNRMFVPMQDAYFDMTPTKFEEYSLQLLREQFYGAENLKIEHNVIEKAIDGNYQIDGIITFTQGGFNFKILVECKHYRSSISREKITVLYDKLRALNAHKGIFISSSNYQKGAIQYATEHKISLVQLVPANTNKPLLRLNKIVNHISFYNNGEPYIGVLQSFDTSLHIETLQSPNKILNQIITKENSF